MSRALPLPDDPSEELLELSIAEAERLTREFFERADRETAEAERREQAEVMLAILGAAA